MTDLKKAMTQKHITFDTVEAQFCSDWLKNEISRLFAKLLDAENILQKDIFECTRTANSAEKYFEKWYKDDNS